MICEKGINEICNILDENESLISLDLRYFAI